MAAVATRQPVSNLAVAFANQAATANIPIPQDGGLASAMPDASKLGVADLAGAEGPPWHAGRGALALTTV
jgi:hypothetical protein